MKRFAAAVVWIDCFVDGLDEGSPDFLPKIKLASFVKIKSQIKLKFKLDKYITTMTNWDVTKLRVGGGGGRGGGKESKLLGGPPGFLIC